MTDTENVQEPLFELPEEQQVLVDLSEARGLNRTLMDELAQLQVRPDLGAVAMVKLDAFLEMVLPEHDRNKVDLVFERRMTGVLHGMLTDRRKSTLGASAGLIVPGR